MTLPPSGPSRWPSAEGRDAESLGRWQGLVLDGSVGSRPEAAEAIQHGVKEAAISVRRAV
jgi:hypothetical protein